MCGICGVLNFDEKYVEPEVIKKMRDVMAHRGPDDAGIWHYGKVGLGHRRLSIIDLSSAGHQPMLDKTGNYVIVYNGELYNFRQLRAELENKGYVFKSRTDTEVVLYAYIFWGSSCVEKFDGMFSFAIWCKKDNTLFMARDRMGIKPLYYAIFDNQFAFASEIKALIQWCPKLNKLNEDVIMEYFIFRNIAGNKTLFKNIYKFPPGHMLTVKDGKIKSEIFWELPIKKNVTKNEKSVEELENILSNSVLSQMVSDVPLGALCSGGLDSSLVTYMANNFTSEHLQTFNVSFPGSMFDEHPYAIILAEQLKTIHHNFSANANDFFESLSETTFFHDEPLSHANSVSIYQIAKLAKREGVKVLLTGEGADELFAGYHHMNFAQKIARYRKYIPKAIINKILSNNICFESSPSLLNKAAALFAKEDELVLFLTAVMRPVVARRLIRKKMKFGLEHRHNLLEKTRGLELTERVHWMDLALYLEPLLIRVDKMTMGTSVESRVPMLGNDVIEWACSKPVTQLIHDGIGKIPLRKIAYNKLPKILYDRKKIGFALPIAEWFRDCPFLLERFKSLNKPSDPVGNILNRKYIDALFKEHCSKKIDHSQILWSILSFDFWIRKFGVQ